MFMKTGIAGQFGRRELRCGKLGWGKIRLALAAVLSMFSFGAQAYDIDTHFYETYMLARYAGIGHEVASQLANFNQWIDVSLWTSPMFPTMIIGGRMRRLYHFPDEFVTYNASQIETGATHGMKLAPLQLVDENDPFGRELLLEGMKKGNFLLVGAGLHVHMDSFGHAGYSFVSGHGEGGHWPDRPWANIERHERMVSALMEDLVAIRKLLPEAALDHEFRDREMAQQDLRSHSRLSAAELASRYNQNPTIQEVVKRDIFEDPRYTREAVATVVETAIAKGLVKEPDRLRVVSADSALYVVGTNAQSIIKTIIERYVYSDGGSVEARIDVAMVHKKLVPGLPLHRISIDEIGRVYFVTQVIDKLTEGLIPRVPTKDGWVAFEVDKDLRAQEIRMRLGDWREAIETVTGQRIRFESKTMFKQLQTFIAKMKGAPMDDFLKSFELITPTKTQRMKWIWSIVRYAVVDSLINLTRLFIETRSFLESWVKAWRYTANPDNMLIAHEKAFDALIKEGVVQQILDEKGLAQIRERHAKASAAAKEAFLKLGAKLGASSVLESRSRGLEPANSVFKKMTGMICRDLFVPAR